MKPIDLRDAAVIVHHITPEATLVYNPDTPALDIMSPAQAYLGCVDLHTAVILWDNHPEAADR